MADEKLEEIVVTPHTYEQRLQPDIDHLGFSKATVKAVRLTEQLIDGVWVAIIGGEDNAK